MKLGWSRNLAGRVDGLLRAQAPRLSGVMDQFFDPRNASPKPSEAWGLHPMGAPRGTSHSGSTTMVDIYNEHRRTSFGTTSPTRPFGARGLDGGRSMYLPAEWGPRTQETTLLGTKDLQ